MLDITQFIFEGRKSQSHDATLMSDKNESMCSFLVRDGL